MTQRRIQDFGSPVTANSLKDINSSYSDPGVLQGFEFVAEGADRLRINPGRAVTDNGVIIIEDEAKFLEVSNTSNPADYTVYYDHNDVQVTGGTPAELVLESGLLTSDVVSGVILGYIRYPGGGVPLSGTHFILPVKLQVGKPVPTRESADWIVPVKNQGYIITNQSGGAITITDVFDTSGSQPEMFVKFRNNSASTGTVTLTFPFKVRNLPFAKLQAIVSTDINTTILPFFLDTDGNVFQLAVAPLTGNPNLNLETFDVPTTSIQESNTLVYVQLQIQAAVNREVKIQALGLSEFNLPI